MPTHSSFTPLPIIGVDRGGKRRYDSQAKRQLIEACLAPGVSLAGPALAHGVNANLLRKWVVKHRQKLPGHAEVTPPAPAFVPVVVGGAAPTKIDKLMSAPEALAASAPDAACRLHARLPNGVTLDFACGDQDTSLVSALIDALGRCHVPASR